VQVEDHKQDNLLQHVKTQRRVEYFYINVLSVKFEI